MFARNYYAKIFVQILMMMLLFFLAVTMPPFIPDRFDDRLLAIHTFLESINILIAFFIFFTTWNFRFDIKDNFIFFIGIMFFPIGAVDMLHTFSHQGMPAFLIESSFAKSHMMWVYSRFLITGTFLVSTIFYIGNRERINAEKLLTLAAFLVLGAIIVEISKVPVPGLFMEGDGVTKVKIALSAVVFSLNILTLFLLAKKKSCIDQGVFYRLAMFLIAINFSEFASVFDRGIVDNYELFIHAIKIFAFYHLYQAIHKEGILENHLLAATVSRLSRKILRKDTSLEEACNYITDAFNYHLQKPDRVAFYLLQEANAYRLISAVGRYAEWLKSSAPVFARLHDSHAGVGVYEKYEDFGEFYFLNAADNLKLKEMNDNIKEVMFIPLIIEDVLQGFIIAYVFYGNRRFTQAQVDAAASLANFATLALEHSKIVAQMHSFSFQDSLTKLYNRRYFMDKLMEMIYDGKCYNLKFAVVIVDMDGMKYINDTYGHQMGDEALKKLAVNLKEAFRQTDVVARLGGDEFGLLLRDTNLEQANQKMAILAELINADPVSGCECKVEISYGCAAFPDETKAPEVLVKLADDRMYEQKSKRKNTRAARKI